ncbi:MAG: bifunctional glutamate N-acetyltransferase/amino-acid acetyltransferase ArgJ [Candidatus Omnitrophica bacterium]|nr:bifunctional glutamate N-acetyltransferase/amino-acid acetyltransferase ArgJ [Candidatus Omnitrophota bacterium]
MQILKGGVTKAKGFKANGLNCGIKRSGKPDLALIYSEKPAFAAGVFTKNSIKAAPLLVTKKHLKNNRAQAIIVNSGNANCFTGSFGLIYAERTANIIADLLKLKTCDVLVASTGIIGKPLPFKKIAKATDSLVSGLKVKNGHQAAKAILTTDKITKEIAVQININGKKVTIGACAKGSGMIAPNMATMLAFITTDAAISPLMLKAALNEASDMSFNCITVDGCMSTNDMVILTANSMAGNKTITTKNKNYQIFLEALQYVCLDLAKKIVLDGEGATKFVEVNVSGVKTEKKAKQIALTIANSNLVKTAAYGSNPNWGRVAAAVGSLGFNITEKDLKIHFSSFDKKAISIFVELSQGSQTATVYTSDLSVGYININSKYN